MSHEMIESEVETPAPKVQRQCIINKIKQTLAQQKETLMAILNYLILYVPCSMISI